MHNGVPCSECEAILRELAEAHTEIRASGEQSAEDLSTPFYELISSEDGTEWTEKWLPRAEFREHLCVSRALRKLFIHRAHTGHLPWRPRRKS